MHAFQYRKPSLGSIIGNTASFERALMLNNWPVENYHSRWIFVLLSHKEENYEIHTPHIAMLGFTVRKGRAVADTLPALFLRALSAKYGAAIWRQHNAYGCKAICEAAFRPAARNRGTGFLS